MSFVKRNRAALALLALAAACFALGAGLGQHETVLRKAVNLCMECIGLG